MSATLLKKTQAQIFSSEICESFRNAYFEEHLRTTAPEEALSWRCSKFEIGLLHKAAFKKTISKKK